MIAFLTSLTRVQQLLLVILAGFAMTVPGLFQLPPLDRDEARFAQATAQMLESEDYLRIKFQDTERNKKPAGIHWLQAASVTALSDVEDRQIWAYRIPSMIGIILAMVSIWGLGRTLFAPPSGEAIGVIAAILFGAAPVSMGEATIAKTDAMQAGVICLMMLAMARSILEKTTQAPKFAGRQLVWPLLFWICLGTGILIKGPIAPMIAFLTAGILLLAKTVAGLGQDLTLSRLRPILGILIIALMVLPWAFGIDQATDGRFFAEAIGGDLLGKVGQSQESHGAPPGYHLILLPILLWPCTIALPAAVIIIWQGRNDWRSMPLSILFLLAWLVPAWIIFELTATKLPHYPLPLYPAIALICARITIEAITKFPERLKFWRLGGLVSAAIGIGFALAFCVLPYLYRSAGIPGWAITVALMLLLASGYGIWLLWRREANKHEQTFERATLIFCALSYVSGAFLLNSILPSLDQLGVSPALSRTLIALNSHPLHNESANGPVILTGYYEPSAVFMLGSKIQLISDPAKTAQALDQSINGTAIIEARQREAFLRAAATLRLSVHEVAMVSGYNYSKGTPVHLTFFQHLTERESE